MNRIRDEKLLIAFGFHLRTMRHSKNLTLEAVADLAGIDFSQVRRIEAGKINPTISTVQALAKGLGVEIVDLFGFVVE
jgi:transcriptional regulator with XRE-family HTH domain